MWLEVVEELAITKESYNQHRNTWPDYKVFLSYRDHPQEVEKAKTIYHYLIDESGYNKEEIFCFRMLNSNDPSKPGFIMP